MDKYGSRLFNYALAAIEISPNPLFLHFLGAYPSGREEMCQEKL